MSCLNISIVCLLVLSSCRTTNDLSEAASSDEQSDLTIEDIKSSHASSFGREYFGQIISQPKPSIEFLGLFDISLFDFRKKTAFNLLVMPKVAKTLKVNKLMLFEGRKYGERLPGVIVLFDASPVQINIGRDFVFDDDSVSLQPFEDGGVKRFFVSKKLRAPRENRCFSARGLKAFIVSENENPMVVGCLGEIGVLENSKFKKVDDNRFKYRAENISQGTVNYVNIPTFLDSGLNPEKERTAYGVLEEFQISYIVRFK